MMELAGDNLFNVAVVVTPEGIAGVHRKIHLPYLGIDRFDGLGDLPFSVFQAGQAKIGVNICYDCSFPESGRVLKLNGRADPGHPHQLAHGFRHLAAHSQSARH